MIDNSVLANLKRNEPIYVRKPKPTFRTEYEKEKYWADKHKLWREGNGILTGMHIYYLDEIYLFNRVTGETYYPICRDIDVIIFNKIEELRQKYKWLYITKGRGIGLSTIAFSIPHWFFRMYAGSKCVATTGKDKTTLGHLFSNYFMHSYNHLDEDIQPKFLNKNETKAESYLRIQLKVKGEDGDIKLRQSEFICKETSDNPKSPTAFSGYGAIYGAFDEIPLHPRRGDLLKSAKEIFINPLTKKVEGFLLGGGTIEDSLTAEDLIQLKQFIDNCESLNFEHLFIPATYGRCMTNGWSDLKKAEEEIMFERAELDKMEDKSYLKSFIKNNPLNLEEIFEMGGGGKFEEDVIKKIRETIKVINQEKPPAVKTDLVDMGGNIISSPVKTSSLIILEPPKQSVMYIGGNDGTGTTQQGGIEQGSDTASVIMKMFDPDDIKSSYTPVAIFSERPKSFEDVYNKNMLLFKHYNKFGNFKLMLESNQANEHFGAFLIKNGLEKCVMMRRDLSGKGNINKAKMGTYRTDDVVEWQYRQANYILRKYGHNFKAKVLLEQMLLPYDTNTDILDAWLMALVGMGIDFDKPVKPKAEYKPEQELVFNSETGRWENRVFYNQSNDDLPEFIKALNKIHSK